MDRSKRYKNLSLRKVKIICDTCGKIYEGNLYTNKNSIKHNCKSCTAIINGKKQSKNKGKAQLNNKTHKIYWLNKGYTEEEAIKKVLNIKQNNIHGASKIEIKCLNELSEYLNIDIIRNKYIRYNNKNYAPDGRYKNFLIEFNGTNTHMDKRFYKEGDINCFKKLYEDIHTQDNERYLQLSNKYYIIIIWEYDYKCNKDNVFNKIKEIINENIENRGLWDSSSI